jgi:serine/threonine protein kinase
MDASGTGQSTDAGAAPPTETLPPGLAGHPDYEVKRELGRGGMGVVYLVHNRLMGRDEVLKMMGRHIMDRPGVLERFLREIRAVARLRHPNIVTAYHAARLGESIVFAMEYVDGLDLSHMVKAKGPLPVGHACNFAYQAALGLQHAHEEGLVHRDIKPGNLIFARRGGKATIKLLDFGLAKATEEEKVDGSLTREGQALGTPDYIAPEQILDAPSADIRADIYSLGATLYYLLTGRPPFQAKSLYDMYQAHISRDAEPLNLARPEISTELAALVAKMMAKDPSQRFQTPGEVAQALIPFFKKANADFKVSEPPVSQSPQSPAAVRWENLIEVGHDRPTSEATHETTSQTATSEMAHRARDVPLSAIERLRNVGPRARWAIAAVFVLVLSAASMAIVLKNRTNETIVARSTTPEDESIRALPAASSRQRADLDRDALSRSAPKPSVPDATPPVRVGERHAALDSGALNRGAPAPARGTGLTPNPRSGALETNVDRAAGRDSFPRLPQRPPATSTGTALFNGKDLLGWSGFIQGQGNRNPYMLVKIDGEDLVSAADRGRVFHETALSNFSLTFNYLVPAKSEKRPVRFLLRLAEGAQYFIGEAVDAVSEIGCVLAEGNGVNVGDVDTYVIGRRNLSGPYSQLTLGLRWQVV